MKKMDSPTQSSPLSISINSDDNDGSSSSSTDIEDLLDPRSSKFSAQLALLCQQSPVSLPCPEAPSYLNVIELEKAIPDPRKEPIFESCLKTSKAKVDNVKKRISKFHSKSKSSDKDEDDKDKQEQLQQQQQQETPIQSQSKQSSTSNYKTRQAQMQAARLKQQQQNKKEDNSQPSTSSSSHQMSTSSSLRKDEIPSSSKQQQQQGEKMSSVENPIYPMAGRKFLPHQMPVYRPKKSHPNILTEMETVEGPLKAIKAAMTSRKRVKIWTRGDKSNSGIRGFCTGIVLGFDKHWNLILWDVDEIFQRKRACYTTTTTNTKCDQDKSQPNVSTTEEKRVCDTVLRTIKAPQTELTVKQSSSSRVQSVDSSLNPILIEGSDALLTCRLHLEALTVHSKMKVDPRYKNTSIRDEQKTSVDNRTISACSSDILLPHVSGEMTSSKNDSITKSQLRKKHVKVFDVPRRDPFGYSVLAQSKNWEIVHRTQKQLFLMGNLVVFVETNPH